MVVKEYCFGDFATFKYGKMPNKERMTECGKYPVYSGYRYVGYYDEYNTEADQLIVVARGVGGTGDVKITTERCFLTNLSISAIIDEEVALPKYLYYFYKPRNLRYLDSGSAQSQITISDLEKIRISLPDISTQRLICSYLEAIDNKIELNNNINKNLEQQAQTIYKSWFIDLEPFDGVVPPDWNQGTVDDLANDVVCGKTPSTKVSEYYGSDIPFITIPDMHGNTYAVTTERYLSTEGANSQAKKTLPKNSICVSCIGTAGLVTLVATESQTNQQINSIIPKEGYSPYYIYLLMQTLSEVINKLGQSGSTIVNLNKAQFGKIQVAIPSLDSMAAFDEIVAPLFNLILENQLENIRLTSLRDTLLPKLMSGELDVSAIEV